MNFFHSPEIWNTYPELVPGIIAVDAIDAAAAVERQVAAFWARAAERLHGGSESDLPEVQAWRRVFSRMGLRPTQYRCAAEALLRRFRKEGALPSIHPLINLCNAASLAFAIPVAVFDTTRIAGSLEVRRATGVEIYTSFAGEIERPEEGEVIFADDKGRAHARRWTNRQSAHSAVSDATASVLIVAEGVHASAPQDVRELVTILSDQIAAAWSVRPRTAVLDRSSPVFEWELPFGDAGL
jgi:DNA/RNA-binding domain of Phe-tRNA-synthetase-like protein